MKNTMSEGCDRELMVNTLMPPLPFTYSLSRQNRGTTYCNKREDKMRNWGDCEKDGHALEEQCLQPLQEARRKRPR